MLYFFELHRQSTAALHPKFSVLLLVLKKGGILCLFSDFPMQLNMALFEFNGRTGYLLKHDVIRRSDKKFDPFCDRIDTVVASTLTIKAGSQRFSQFLSVQPSRRSAMFVL